MTKLVDLTSATFGDEFDIESNQEIISPRIVAASFVEYLYQFFRQTEIHDPANQIFEKCLENLFRAMNALRRVPGFEEIKVVIRGEQVYVNATRMRPKARQFYKQRFLLRYLRSRKLGALVFPEKVEAQPLLGFLWAIAELGQTEQDPVGAIEHKCSAQGIRDYRVESVKGFHANDSDKASMVDLELITLVLQDKIRKFAETVFENKANAAQFELTPIQDHIRDLLALSEEDLLQVFRSNLLKRRDRPLGHMAADSCIAMIAWAKSLGLPGGVVAELAGAALAHPLVYLMRKSDEMSPLSSEEQSQFMKLLFEVSKVWPLSEVQRLCLFEWTLIDNEVAVYDWQGSKCYAHFFSRMLRIVATFKWMTQYRKGAEIYLPDEAMAALIKQKEKFDSTFLKLFVNWMGVYPVGSLVQLRSGEICQVFAAGADPLKFQRPIVSVLKDEDGVLLKRPRLLDLSEMNEQLGVYKKTIAKSLTLEEANISEETLGVPPARL